MCPAERRMKDPIFRLLENSGVCTAVQIHSRNSKFDEFKMAFFNCLTIIMSCILSLYLDIRIKDFRERPL